MDDGRWEKFAQPRGWALKWDGAALAGIQARQAGDSKSSTVTTG
jgi:hypothetical protein